MQIRPGLEVWLVYLTKQLLSLLLFTFLLVGLHTGKSINLRLLFWPFRVTCQVARAGSNPTKLFKGEWSILIPRPAVLQSFTCFFTYRQKLNLSRLLEILRSYLVFKKICLKAVHLLLSTNHESRAEVNIPRLTVLLRTNLYGGTC